MNTESGFTLDPSKFVYMGQGERRNHHHLTWFPLLSQGILEAFLMDFFLDTLATISAYAQKTHIKTAETMVNAVI